MTKADQPAGDPQSAPMSASLPVIAILQASENAAADDALVEGLAAVRPADQKPILDALLARKRERGLAGVVAHFHNLDANLRQEVLDHVSVFFPVLRRVIKAPEEQARLNAVELVGRAGSYRLAYLLGLALHDVRPLVRQRAAAVLRSLADRYFRQEKVTLKVLGAEQGRPDMASVQSFSLARLAEERGYLIAAIGEALTGFEVHQRPEVVETAIWFAAHINERLLSAVANTRSHCGRAVIECMQSTTDPRMVPFAYEALTYRDLRAAVANGIANQRNDAYMTEFVRWAFLTADQRIRRGLAAVRKLAWLDQGIRPIVALPDELYPRAVDLLLAISLPMEQRVSYLRDMLYDGKPEAQRAALWGLISIDDEVSTQVIRTVVHWEDRNLAAIAWREVKRRHPEDTHEPSGGESDDGSPAAEGTVLSPAVRITFERYWNQFDLLEEEDRYRLGRVLVSEDRDLLSQLRQKLVSTAPRERLRGLQVVGLLEIASDLDRELYRLARDPDDYVRSLAVAVLSQIPGPTSERVLLEALIDPNERVQANAIESLEHLRAVNRIRQIRERLSSRDNRVRANAIKAALTFQCREAVEALMEMLEHEMSTHRLSALWVAESLRLMSLSAKIIRMAKSDPDVKVRRRALQAISVFQTALKEGVCNPPVPAASMKETT